MRSWRRTMRGRDPQEAHRTTTPLELLFDLAFVVAVSQAATQLFQSLEDGRIGPGVFCYAMVFFAIWWAWMNFSWFASAYDTDDILNRLLTFLQMAGVLILAAGVPAAFKQDDFATITFGYVVMRVAMIAQWLRAAREHPAGRLAAQRYAVGVALVQLGWLGRLLLAPLWGAIGFGILVACELAVPVWAETHQATHWHPGHMVDRYRGFTMIVLGEVMLATLASLHDALARQGLSISLLFIAAGGLLSVFGLWWLYFTENESRLNNLRRSMVWGYGHYFLFAATAALGAGLRVALHVGMQRTSTDASSAGWTLAIPLVVVLLVLFLLHWVDETQTGRGVVPVLGGAGTVMLLALGTFVIGVPATELAMGMAIGGAVVLQVARVA